MMNLERVKYLLFSIVLMFWGGTKATAQQTEQEEEALTIAKKENKYILLVFSGSDWCQPCIRFDKNILQHNTFKEYSKKKLVVLKCDFPQRKQLAPDLLKQNEALAEKYNANGDFPALILLDQSMKPVAILNYKSEAVEQFIQQIEQQLPKDIGWNDTDNKLKEYRKKVPLMGSFFEFIIVGNKEEPDKNWNLVNACITEAKRIESLISEWQPNSEISLINQQAGQKGVKVSTEVYTLLQRSIATGKLTQGAFDISFLPFYDYWKFGTKQVALFDTNRVHELKKRVDYTKIELRADHIVYLPQGMKIGTGGIGQGYAVDKIKALLLNKGVSNFVINSSGDIFAQGKRADGKPWKIGIASPLDKNKIIQWLPVQNFAVVTSGTSEKNFEYQNEIYGHIINPKTGFPVKGLQSVTIMSPYAEVADVLAISILILGREVGMDLINQMPNTHCIIIDEKEQVYYSDKLELNNAD